MDNYFTIAEAAKLLTAEKAQHYLQDWKKKPEELLISLIEDNRLFVVLIGADFYIQKQSFYDYFGADEWIDRDPKYYTGQSENVRTLSIQPKESFANKNRTLYYPIVDDITLPYDLDLAFLRQSVTQNDLHPLLNGPDCDIDCCGLYVETRVDDIYPDEVAWISFSRNGSYHRWAEGEIGDIAVGVPPILYFSKQQIEELLAKQVN
jgi:hypothetical protein